MVEVTQEDIEVLSWDLLASISPAYRDAIYAAFARHRIAARKRALEEAASDLRGPESWLDRWAQHVGNCGGDAVCTCGLVRARYDLATAIHALSDSHVGQD